MLSKPAALTQCATNDNSQGRANRTTVNVSLTPELGEFLQSQVTSGRYQTTSEVVREALRLLERQEQDSDRTFQELKAKLERGASQADRGELLDGETAIKNLQQKLNQWRAEAEV